MKNTNTGLKAALLCSTLLLAPAVMAGTITGAGSGSTYPLVSALADAYTAQNPATTFDLTGKGSSAGAHAALNGEVNFSFLSRKLKPKEIDSGLKGVNYAIDGVGVFMSAKSPLNDISLEELKNIYTGKKTNWPDGKKIIPINHDTESGTREVFQKKVLGKGAEFKPGLKVIPSNKLSRYLAIKKNALAYYSAALAQKSKKIKALSVNGVAPSSANLVSGSYPIARTLTLATKGEPSPEVKGFIEFVRSPAGKTIIKNYGMEALP